MVWRELGSGGLQRRAAAGTFMTLALRSMTMSAFAVMPGSSLPCGLSASAMTV